MEIQGLTAAQNTYRQHGVSCRTDLSSPGTTNERCRTISTGGRSTDELREPESDSNKRPRTSPFRILSEHGSGSGGSLHSFKQNAGRSKTQETQAFGANIGLYNVVSSHGNGVKKQLLQQDCRETGLKNETEESGLHFAFPVYLVDECQSQQSQQQRGTKRQPHKDGATLHNALVRETTPGVKTTTTTTTTISPKTSSKETEGYYVVFNVVEGEDSTNNLGSNKETGRALCPSKDEKGKDAGVHRTRQDMSMEINSSSEMLHPDEKLPVSVAERNFREGLCFEPGEGANSVVVVKEPNRSEQGPRKQSSDIMPVSDIGATSTEQLPDELPQSEQQQQNHGAYITDMSGIDNGSNSLSDFPAIAANSLSCSGLSHSETFSGTITINNQNIIVTIENGVLTLATPQEGHAHKEGVVNLKEQLGVKESQDIVLINCSSATTKTIGNASCTEAGSVQYEEPRGCLSVSDLGLTLNSDCSFSDPSSALDSCTSGKEQEDGTLCSLDEGDGAQAGYMLCDGVEPQPAKRDESAGMIFRKGLVTYHCPQQGCAETFDTKHKLKVHLLSHTEDQRPFRCSVEGCGWSFTTSYKLKRHLQSHDKVRPFACPWESCGRRFTTVYNLKAHVKMHDQESAFVCEICSERFRTATRLGNHQRTHFEPERPHKCEYPGCEKTFITFSALFSHNRTHFRETDQFNCTYPGCDKRYDKACRLKIHLRSHTGERPFVCDFEGCGWSFTSMSKLLRHRRKHDDDRRFTCQEEGCGKSFTRAEHLKGHRITHLGTKPFECPVEGCSAKFSARSSLYIHSKKHQQDSGSQRTRCPVASCSKHFSSRGSLRTHMLKHHNLSPDLLSQLEISTSLTPSSELTCVGQSNGVVGASASGAELGNLDLSSLFSNVPGGSGAAVSGAPSNLSLDMSLVSSGILTIDATSVGATLGGPTGALAQAVDPLILAAAPDMGSSGLDSALVAGTSGVLPQTTLSLEDVQTVNPEALGSLAAVAMRGSVAPDPLGSPADAPTALLPSSSLAGSHVPELLSPGPKEDRSGGAARNGPDVLAHPDGGKVVTQFVFPDHTEGFSAQKDAELGTISACPFLESRGSARTDYRAIQLAKRKKRHKGPGSTPGCPSLGQRKNKGAKAAGVTVPTPSTAGHFGAGVASSNGGLTVRDPATGAQFVQIQLLQDDPAGDGDLAFQLSSQTSSSHSQLTVDLPVNILQEPPATPEDDAGSDTSQFTGSTINLQDLE